MKTLTLSQFASRLCYSPKTIYKTWPELQKKHNLTVMKIGKKLIFLESDAEKILKRSEIRGC